MQVDPKKDGDGSKARECGAGVKVLVGTGFERYTSDNGNLCLSVRFVCVQDLNNGPDVGAEIFENFTLTEAAVFRLARYANAAGHNAPFDADDDDDIERIIQGFVTADVKLDAYKGKTRMKIHSFEKPRGVKKGVDWDEMIEESEKRHTKYLEWRRKNPRGSGGGGRQRSVRQSEEPTATEGGQQGADDEVPF